LLPSWDDEEPSIVQKELLGIKEQSNAFENPSTSKHVLRAPETMIARLKIEETTFEAQKLLENQSLQFRFLCTDLSFNLQHSSFDFGFDVLLLLCILLNITTERAS
jgi:hypothetical protein